MSRQFGHLRCDDGSTLPYFVDPQGETRILAALPTPTNHMMMSAVPTWLEAGYQTIDRKDWRTFSRVQSSVPILDQNGKGACLPHAFARWMMLLRIKMGLPFVKLSPWFLYSLINRGMDAGSNAGDAIQALRTTGICPDDLVPYTTIRPKGYNQAAMQAASEFKLVEAVRLKGFDEVVSAVIQGWDVCIDVCAGAAYNTDSDGVVRYLPGGNNHEVFVGEGLARLASGEYVLDGANSWGERWGVKGRCFYRDRTINASGECWAGRILAPRSGDPRPPSF